jgi:uncharacterized coiled-coil DUF342 family protein
MGNPQPENLETSYNEVVALYEKADALIASVNESSREFQEVHFKLVMPLVEQLESSTDILTEEFISIAEGKDNKANHAKRVEGALRKVYTSLDEYGKRASSMGKEAFSGLVQRLEVLVEDTKRQLEKVVGIFVGMVNIGLDRIMQKNDLERLRKNETKVAQMLHSMSAAHGKAT